ncbi:MAG TPA: protein kinase, partial [Polyangiaceae bacterium]
MTPAPDEAETVVESASQQSMATSIALRSEELTRARAFYRLTAIMTAVAAAFMPVVPGSLRLRACAAALCAIVVGANIVALRRMRDETHYEPRFVALMGALLGIVGELVLFAFLGLFTASVMVLPLGVYFFGLSESRFAARFTYFVGAIGYAVLSIGVATNVFPDYGPLPITALAAPWRVFFIIMVQVVFATTYFLARSSRRATEAAVAQVERANRRIMQNEALLDEARGELDRALRPGEGRYTDQMIGAWKLGALLGRGGMGEVYRAARAGSDGKEELAAIKLLHPIILDDSAHVKRFEREAELARKVDSPFVARVIGSGAGPSGIPYVAMELLAGKDLAWHLRQKQRMTLEQVTVLVDHVAQALAAIREAG